MKTVLWISRHAMTDAQLADLCRVMGEPVRLLPWQDTVEDLSALLPLIRESDAVAAVLPPELLGQLLKLAGDRPVLRAVGRRELTGRMNLSPEGKPEPEYRFVHDAWEQVLRVEVLTRRL